MRPMILCLLLTLGGLGACDKDRPTPAAPPTDDVADGGKAGEAEGAEAGRDEAAEAGAAEGAEEGADAGAEKGGDAGASGYDPCAGKTCGDQCTVCPPDDADCVETMVVKVCDAAGRCDAHVPECP